MAFVYDELSLYIWPEPVVMAATINGILAPGAMSIPYVFTSGVEADVVAGMTLLAVGCGPMGRDIRIRIRSINVGSAVLNVAENGIYWATNAVIRVLKFFEPWSVVPRITVAGAIATFYADYDIVCTDQTQFPQPVVVMGPNYAGPPGDSVAISSAGSWSPTSQPLLTGTVSVDGGTEITPGVWKFNTPGSYLATCQVTDTKGKIGTGYRHIFIGEPKRNWGVSSFEGSRQTGGYTVKCWTTDTWTDLHDGALIVLRWKTGVAFVGYVQDSSIKFDYAKQRTEFTAISLSLVLNKLDVFGSSLGFKANAPYTWNEVRNLDLDSAVSTHLRWHTTVLQIADVHPITNTYQIQKADFARGGGFSPVRDFLKVACRGDVVCDAQGTFWCERDQNMLALSSRKGTSYIIEREDWRADPQVEDDAIPSVSYMEVGGVAYSGATGTFGAYLSQAPGPLPDRYGTSEIVEGLALPTTNPQTWLNEIAGFIFADRNNRYQRIQIPAVGRWKKSDIAPQAWALTRGFPWVTDSRVQISRIRHAYNPRQQHVMSDLEAFAETWGPYGFSKAIPVIPPCDCPPPPEPPIIPPPVCDDPTALNYGLPGPCVYASTEVVLVMTPHHLGYSENFFESVPTIWTDIVPDVVTNGLGHCMNMALAKTTGEAWVLTQKTGVGTDAENGMFYCADVTDPARVWTLIYSQQDYWDEVIALYPTWTPQQLSALGLSDVGTIYAQAYWSNLEAGGYVWGDSGGIQYQRCPVFNVDLYNIGHQFDIWSGPTTVRAALTGGPNPAGRIIEMTDALAVSVFFTFIDPMGANNMTSIHQNNVVGTVSLGSFIDGGAVLTEVHVGADKNRPIVITDGFMFWTLGVDGSLMIDAAVQALTNTVGAVTGVFSAAGAGGGGYCNVQTYAHIIWIAASNDVLNSIRNIGYTEDGGFVWVTKDGNWATAMGDVWEGDAGIICPMVAYASVV